ncbi:hypothetical protein HYQ46_006741 [Verticillium longisporum]|nr:hypothetical protein HYQ46_006741 [Verticillium longisporum]
MSETTANAQAMPAKCLLPGAEGRSVAVAENRSLVERILGVVEAGCFSCAVAIFGEDRLLFREGTLAWLALACLRAEALRGCWRRAKG